MLSRPSVIIFLQFCKVRSCSVLPMICIVGGGKMGAAIASGLVAHDQPVTIVESNASTREQLTQRFPNATVADAPVAADGAIIAVKPKDALVAASDAADAGAKRVLSIAAGVTLTRLHEAV